MPALSIAGPLSANDGTMADFKTYLKNSTHNPFSIDLSGLTLIEVVLACARVKKKLYPNYHKNIRCLLNNLRELESECETRLMPIQVTDVFWGYFISFCQGRGLKGSSITTMCNQLKAILTWASKYNASVSPTYTDVKPPKAASQEIALTADDISRIAYFDIDLFYAKKRPSYRETMHRVRDMFVLSVCLFQRHSDMVRISPECFDRNTFRITQQKTGNIAIVNIDKYSVDAKTAYRILEKYGYEAPYKSEISNYNHHLHELMRDVGFNEPIRAEERIDGQLVTRSVPRWKMISSHTARRSAITIGVTRGINIHALRKCSGHEDLRVFDKYVRDE